MCVCVCVCVCVCDCVCKYNISNKYTCLVFLKYEPTVVLMRFSQFTSVLITDKFEYFTSWYNFE